ncbi:MAG: C40 family peptidase [Muribaculaceae bacterium]|nr:C40 family peptidase [Muribaculaceae bacterium]
MTLKTILTSALFACFSITGIAQTTAHNAHRQAHQTQLANVRSNKMDKSVVDGILKNDIAKRESEVVNKVSEENQTLIADLLKEANKHIGKPYRHGMKGPNAFDCSGFTSYVYKQFGYSISPASRIQINDGERVDRKELRKGDLVFFTSRSSGKNVGHVGIVVDADNETGKFSFIHASIKGVRINECEGYYENRYVGACRIIKD